MISVVVAKRRCMFGAVRLAIPVFRKQSDTRSLAVGCENDGDTRLQDHVVTWQHGLRLISSFNLLRMSGFLVSMGLIYWHHAALGVNSLKIEHTCVTINVGRTGLYNLSICFCSTPRLNRGFIWNIYSRGLKTYWKWEWACSTAKCDIPPLWWLVGLLKPGPDILEVFTAAADSGIGDPAAM